MKGRKLQISSETSKTRERILAFDLIRILCVAIIVYDHSQYLLIPGINQFLFPDGYGPFNIYTHGLQGYAVFGMIFISGAVLEYNYSSLENLHGYLQFLFRRFIRLYPAFWMSLVLSLIFFPILIWQNSLPSILFEFTGFFVVLGQGPGSVNIMGWFIAAIVSLYLLFPWFSKIIRRYGLGALFCFCFMSWGLRFLILTYNIIPIDLFWRWFPLCNAFEFCLGIYIVQTTWFPKTVNTYPIVKDLSDLSYYVFIFHVVVIRIFTYYLRQSLGMFDVALTLHNYNLADTIWYLQILTGILLVSWIAMKIDTRLRSWVLKRDAIRNFLEAQ